MCHDGESFNRFHAVVAPSKEQMIAEGFSAFAVEDFYDSFMEQLGKLSPNTNDNSTENIDNPKHATFPSRIHLNSESIYIEVSGADTLESAEEDECDRLGTIAPRCGIAAVQFF